MSTPIVSTEEEVSSDREIRALAGVVADLRDEIDVRRRKEQQGRDQRDHLRRRVFELRADLRGVREELLHQTELVADLRRQLESAQRTNGADQ